MTKVKATVDAGICGFITQVIAISEDERYVTFEIETMCEKIENLRRELPESFDAYEEVGAGFEGKLQRTVRTCFRGCCSGCVVPSGLFKAMQIAANLALPKDLSVKLERL